MFLESVVKASLAEPSITSWTRLEPQPRDGSMERSLQSQVRDPLWMLARLMPGHPFRPRSARNCRPSRRTARA